MNYVYLIYSGQVNSVLKKFLLSLDEHCKCTILFHHIKVKIDEIKKMELNNQVVFIKVDESSWNKKRMFCKIEALSKFPFEDGDNVFVLDTDLLFQGDIFEVFEKDFDVAVTSRHYTYWYPINAGVWCFKYSEVTKKFLEFYVSQMLDSNWEPFVAFQKRFKHKGKLDWYCDQDFLCVAHKEKLPFDCQVLDLGCKYNFCPSVEDSIPGSFEKASKEISAQIGNNEYKVLHFKGRLKELML